ncbi:MAG: hypothetical protein ABR600_09535, partial [Actinomycetota bacterium]
GTEGRTTVSVDPPAAAHGLTRQPDHKILVLGAANGPSPRVFQLIVARFEPNGSPDTTFGDNGVASEPMPSVTPVDIAVDGSGEIVAATAGYGSSLTRVLPDGTVDQSFGRNGWAGRGDATFSSIAIRKSGRIVAAGSSPGCYFALLGFQADGERDHSFAPEGKVESTFPGGATGRYEAMRIDPQGRIVAAGVTLKRKCGPEDDFALARYVH